MGEGQGETWRILCERRHARYSPAAFSFTSAFSIGSGRKGFPAGGAFHGAFPAIVEIAPILAVQYTIDLDRIKHHCGAIEFPTLEQMLEICLPSKPQAEAFHTLMTPQSLLLKTKSMMLSSAPGRFS